MPDRLTDCQIECQHMPERMSNAINKSRFRWYKLETMSEWCVIVGIIQRFFLDDLPSGYLLHSHGKIHPFLRTVSHLFLWAIEKPWRTVSHNQRV